MSAEPEAPWTEADTTRFAVAILDSDADSVADWVEEHVTSYQREYAVLGALPMWCALLVRQFMPDPGEDGFWALQALRPDVDPQALGVTQMIAAALNDDQDALFGHVDALFEREPECRAKVLIELARAFRDFGRIVHEKRTADGGAS